jgi:fructose-1,6-bisphosphatase II
MTTNAALNSVHWLGRGAKESADAAACDAINGCFDQVDMCGEVVIGEGIKDDAPGIFLGERLGTWREGAPRFLIALDPIDGTTNISKGMPNSISVMAAVHAPEGTDAHMANLPTFYSQKLAYGPRVAEVLRTDKFLRFNLDSSTEEVIEKAARILGKHVKQIVVLMLDRPRHGKLIEEVRSLGASLRLLHDGDITAAIAPSLSDAGVDLYMGTGGSPEGVLAAAALRTLGGDMQLRMVVRDEEERQRVSALPEFKNLSRIYHAEDLVKGPSAIFCATGISDSSLLKGVKFIGRRAHTHTVLMRGLSRTVRFIEATHNLDHKTIRLRSDNREHLI